MKQITALRLAAALALGLFASAPAQAADYPTQQIKVVVPLPPGSGVTVHMWRRGSATKVWYEWAAECAGVHTHVHNPNGRSYHVGL